MKIAILYLSIACADVFDFSATDKEQNGTRAGKFLIPIK